MLLELFLLLNYLYFVLGAIWKQPVQAAFQNFRFDENSRKKIGMVGIEIWEIVTI